MRELRLLPPRPVRRWVLRPRLLSVVGERFDRRLVVIVAGAGFGKSTLLAQAMAENLLDPCGVDVWLDCRVGDVAASELGGALLAALGAETATAKPGCTVMFAG